MKKKVFITTAIPYANAAPHIGTAMDYLYGDILLRHFRENGLDAKLTIGTDEHGQKIEMKAAENGKTPQEFVDEIHPEFAKMREEMKLDFGPKNTTVDYIEKPLAEQKIRENYIINVRTTDPTHVELAQEIWRKLDAAGAIYKGKYEGWYCTGHEQFFTETEAKEMDYFCVEHNRPLDKISEENYYLRVSKYTDEIREFAKKAVVPNWRGKEILELVKDGAQDVSISRPREKLSWGVPVPGDENQVMYVWVEALGNYITALGLPREESDFWSENSEIIEIVGKDIVRFHAIIWPAMLLALRLKLPDKLLTHGFINVAGSKMSKSIGNVVSPLEIIENYGSDAFRFYFAKNVSTFDDGDFTWEKFEQAYNGELANDLGNLVSRSANMLKKYEVSRNSEIVFANADKEKFAKEYDEKFAELNLAAAFENAWKEIQLANQFIDETKPWMLAKTEPEKLENVLNELWNQLIFIAKMLAPFLPETSRKMEEIFAKNDGEKITESAPILFPKKYLHTDEPRRK